VIDTERYQALLDTLEALEEAALRGNASRLRRRIVATSRS
jgi:hypothetical protein